MQFSSCVMLSKSLCFFVLLISTVSGRHLRGTPETPRRTSGQSIICETQEQACYKDLLCRTCMATASIPIRPVGKATQSDLNSWFYGIEFAYPDECNYLDGKSLLSGLFECRYNTYAKEAGLPRQKTTIFLNSDSTDSQYTYNYLQHLPKALPMFLLLFVKKSSKAKNMKTLFMLYLKTHMH